jgi:hypothetical protein
LLVALNRKYFGPGLGEATSQFCTFRSARAVSSFLIVLLERRKLMVLSFCQSASDRQNPPILQHLPAYTGRFHQTPAAPRPALVAHRTKPTRLFPARRPSMHTVRSFSDTLSDHVPVPWTVQPEPARNPLRVHGLVCFSLDRRPVAISPLRLLRHHFHLPYLTLTSCVCQNT